MFNIWVKRMKGGVDVKDMVREAEDSIRIFVGSGVEGVQDIKHWKQTDGMEKSVRGVFFVYRRGEKSPSFRGSRDACNKWMRGVMITEWDTAVVVMMGEKGFAGADLVENGIIGELPTEELIDVMEEYCGYRESGELLY